MQTDATSKYTAIVNGLPPMYTSYDSNTKIYSVVIDNQPQILKQIRCFDPSQVTKAFKEADFAIAHPHPHICQCLEKIEEPQSEGYSYVYIVMEHLDMSLVKEMKRRVDEAGEREKKLSEDGEREEVEKKKFSEDELWRYLKDLVGVYAYLQRNEIAHRDIKLDNMLLTKNGDVKVCDFGFTKKIDKNGIALSTLLGSVPYFSPKLREALIGGQKDMIAVQHNVFKSDVYSLGISMFFLTVCEIPEFITNLRDLQANTTSFLNSIRGYSQSWIDVLGKMLLQEEVMRPDFTHLEIELVHPSEYADDESIAGVPTTGEVEDALKVELKAGLAYVRVSPEQQDTVPVLVTLTATPQNPSLRSTTLDLVCVVDQSGSMSGRPLELVQVALTQIVSMLGDRDRVCVVGFSDEADRKCPLTACTSEGKRTILRVIESLEALDASNVIAGVDVALKVVRQRRMKNSEVAVLIFTDGGHNCEGDAKGVCGDMLRHCGIDSMTVHWFKLEENQDIPLPLSFPSAPSFIHILTPREPLPPSFCEQFPAFSPTVVRHISLHLRLSLTSKVPVKITKVYTSPLLLDMSLTDLPATYSHNILFLMQPSPIKLEKPISDAPLTVNIQYRNGEGTQADVSHSLNCKFKRWDGTGPMKYEEVFEILYYQKSLECVISARDLSANNNFPASRSCLQYGLQELLSSGFTESAKVQQAIAALESELAALEI